MSEKHGPRLLDLYVDVVDGLYFIVLGMNMLKGLTRHGMFPAECNAEHAV